jgi:uncharacterized repeat protein (TIGR01451 family)
MKSSIVKRLPRENDKKHTSKASIPLVFVALAAFVTVGASTATAKSLYVIADIKGASVDATQPVQAYDIGVDGTLTFQAQHDIPHRMLGAVGMAIDADSGYVFITYEASDEIQLLNPITMTDAGTTIAPDAKDLAGIVYDHSKKLLYTVDRGQDVLYVYNWDPKTTTLTHVEGSPFTLRRASAFGIAVDEIHGLLYVANASKNVTVYSTADWKLVDTITLSRIAISIAVDVKDGLMYTGAGYAGNWFLTQYDLTTGTENEVQVEPDAGVMGLAVDPQTGLVYLDTGVNNAPGGDNLQAYDEALNQIDLIPAIGNPTGLAIPGREIGYNPLNLKKTAVGGVTPGATDDETPSVGAGGTMTYDITFDNKNELAVTGVSVVDALPQEVTFVSAVDDGVNGHYDPKTHSYRWLYPALAPGSSMGLELTVKVDPNVEVGSVIRNTATVNSNETPPTTTCADVIVANSALNVTKSIFGVDEGQRAWVDINAPLTYTICFDNNDIGMPVTNVTVMDVLPDEVSFVSADGGKTGGKYDPATHTYIWSYPILEAGQTVCLGLVVNVNPDVAPGTTFTNSVTVDSNETPPGTASVDATTYYNPLNLTKSIVGAADDKPKWAGPGDKITYTIAFDNKANDSAVNNVSVVDTLPPYVSFVSADGDGTTGHYDSKAHIYTWSYASVPGKSTAPTSLELVVQVDKDAPPATVLTNSVTIDSDETRPTTASADAITYYKDLNVSKSVVGSAAGETAWVDANDVVTYSICFDNDNDAPVTNVSLVDTLPKQVTFISADADGVSGQYDSKAHTYTWSYSALPAGSSTCLQLAARVNAGTAPATTITNRVTIDSDETMPSTATADVAVSESPIEVADFRIVPDIIRRSSATYDVQAIAILPPGIAKDDVKDVLPTLYPGNVKARRQIVYGNAGRTKVVAVFDKADLMKAIPDRGKMTWKVVGRLKTGRSFAGEATVYITNYTGG